MIREKLLNKEKLTEEEVEQLAYGDYNEDIGWVEEVEGEDRRWSRGMTVILQVDDRFFSIYYEKGLTEIQENQFNSQAAREVKKQEKVIIDWVAI